MAVWQIQEAKAHLSEAIEKAVSEGPQIIIRHGQEWAVLLSIEEYRNLKARKPSLTEFLLGGPKVDDFDIPRDKDTGRDIEF